MNGIDDEGQSATHPPTPPITDALRAQAKAHPDTWIYAVDPGFDGPGDVPPHGIVGAWRADGEGELTGEFMPNPRYLPTPQARGWDEPTTPLERVLQLVLTGYLPDERLAQEFASSEVFVFDRPAGGLFLAPAQDGGRLAYAFTDAAKAAASGHTENRGITGADLVTALPADVRVVLNPGSAVSSLLPSESTRA